MLGLLAVALLAGCGGTNPSSDREQHRGFYGGFGGGMLGP